jgi:hypothetical protein
MNLLHTVIYPLILKQMSSTLKERSMVRQNKTEIGIKRVVWPGMVVHGCNPSTLGG